MAGWFTLVTELTSMAWFVAQCLERHVVMDELRSCGVNITGGGVSQEACDWMYFCS